MKRSERIYQYIQAKSSGYNKEQLQGKVGFDAQEIADALGILRNNVSKELNALHRESRIVKFRGRPVRYFDQASLANILDVALNDGPYEFDDMETCCRELGASTVENPFAHLIGADGSLKRQVEQAKAAILYPPNGLHTLIVGQTGVGKTLFAHLMFAYGKTMHRFADDAPFITFNCADYYNNPQLLISYVFGHVKGAFTGADTAKAGLVEEADGGILFLDEIHRLPPEGQEMIFYFMDTGTFNRLGETTRSRHANVLIIGATTEDPNSALTRTFVRRIPNIIHIRPLSERTLDEKLDILRLLLHDEAQRVKKPIRIGSECIKALLGSIGNGNVGQLKSNVKLLCAQAFLNSIDHPDSMEIDFKMLPSNIKEGLLTLSANRQELRQISKYVKDFTVIQPDGKMTDPGPKEVEAESGFNLYQVVEDKVARLKGEGISSDLIKQVVATDVNVHVRELYNQKYLINMTTRERLLRIVDASIVDFAEQVALYVQQRLNKSYSDRFLYAFSLHLSAFLKRAKAGAPIPYEVIGDDNPKDLEYLRVAMGISQMIQTHYHVPVSHGEIEYIALLIESSIDDDELSRGIAIIVATHGKETASSMVDVAQRLFSSTETQLIAVDMPLEENPQKAFDRILARAETLHCQEGILILADMGSLCNIGPILADKLKVPVRTLDMVSTPLILEAMRKADIGGMDLQSIYESLLHFKGYESMEMMNPVDQSGKEDAIVTICASGQGAAVKLKAMIEEVLKQADCSAEIIPIGVVHLNEALRDIAETYNVRAAVGMKKPAMDIPFISLEQLIDGDGEQKLVQLLQGHEVKFNATEVQSDAVVAKLCEESLNKFLTYLNPTKIMHLLLEFDRNLEKSLHLHLSNPIKVRLLVHTGCALERVVMRSPLSYHGDKEQVDEQKVKALREAAQIFNDALKLQLTDDEYYFMANML